MLHASGLVVLMQVERDPLELWKDTQRQPALVGAADDPRTVLLREKVELKLKVMAPGESAVLVPFCRGVACPMPPR